MEPPERRPRSEAREAHSGIGGAPRFVLDASRPEPLLKQLEDGFVEAIRSGGIAPGARLPSTRELARELGVSRMTVSGAYARLRADGLIQSLKGSGTYVTADLPATLSRPQANNSPEVTAEFGRGALPLASESLLDDAFHAADLPFRTWSAMAYRAVPAAQRQPDERAFGYGPLREAISDFLAYTRGIKAPAERILVTGGYRSSLRALLPAIATSTTVGWIASPGDPRLRDALALSLSRVMLAPLDADGLDVEWVARNVPDASVAAMSVTRDALFCQQLSPERRSRVLDWAEETESWIVETDFDGEFFTGKSARAPLCVDDGAGRVLHLGGLDRVLFPAARLGYAVIPESVVGSVRDLLTPVRGPFDVEGRPPPHVEATITEFLTSGQCVRQIRKLRVRYEARRIALSVMLAKAVPGCPVDACPSGLHSIVWLGEEYSDAGVARALGLVGIHVRPTSYFRFGEPGRQGVVFTYAGQSVDQLRTAGKTLEAAWAGALAASPRTESGAP